MKNGVSKGVTDGLSRSLTEYGSIAQRIQEHLRAVCPEIDAWDAVGIRPRQANPIYDPENQFAIEQLAVDLNCFLNPTQVSEVRSAVDGWVAQYNSNTVKLKTVSAIAVAGTGELYTKKELEEEASRAALRMFNLYTALGWEPELRLPLPHRGS